MAIVYVTNEFLGIGIYTITEGLIETLESFGYACNLLVILCFV